MYNNSLKEDNCPAWQPTGEKYQTNLSLPSNVPTLVAALVIRDRCPEKMEEQPDMLVAVLTEANDGRGLKALLCLGKLD